MQIDKIREVLFNSLQSEIDISNQNVLIFGAGNTSMLYNECFQNENINIKAFIDNNPEKKGKTFLDKNVISFEEAKDYDPIILISSTNEENRVEIKAMLENACYENYFVDEFVFKKNCDKIMNVFELFDDDMSKEVYADIILARMNKKALNLDLVSSDKYYAINKFEIGRYCESFVDCGAYVGDSIEEYIKVKEGVFDKIYGFEPSLDNFTAMRYRVERLNKEWALSENKITLINAGVGEKTSKMILNNQTSDAASLSAIVSNGDSGNNIDVYALDDYFSDKKVSFIKADIESFEEKMIRGAEKVIKRDKPLMAICVYHTPSDMYRIPLLLKEFNSDYKFSLRQHSMHLAETVLHAY